MRRPLLIAGGVLAALLLVALLCVWALYGRIGTWVFHEKVLPRIEARLGRSVDIGEVEVGRGRVTLKQVSLPGDPDDEEPLIQMEEVVVTYDYGASWLGKVKLEEVLVRGLYARPRVRADGSDNFRELIGRVRKGRKETGGRAEASSNRMSSVRPELFRLEDAGILFRNEATGARYDAKSVSVRADKTQKAEAQLASVNIDSGLGVSALLKNLVVQLDMSDPLGSAQVQIGDGEVGLWKGMSLSGIAGEVKQGDNSEQLVIDLSGSYGGSTETMWKAQGWLEPKNKRGVLTINAKDFSFERISSVLEGSIVQDYTDTSIDTEFVIEVEEGKADISGHFNLNKLTIHHPMLSEKPMRKVSFKSELMASVDSKAKRVELVSLDLESKGVHYQLSGSVALAGGLLPDGTRLAHPKLKAHMVVPRTPCQKVLRSIPREFLPKLKGFELSGEFAADIELEIDWADLDNSTVLDGSVGLAGCQVLSPSPEFNTRRLMGSFRHQILVGPEQYKRVRIGMESNDYAQIFDISSAFLNALMTQEDSQFYSHKGFIVPEFHTALVKNLKAGRFKYGASSITMQMVKNVFLYRDKTISRKFQELFLTWYVEGTLDKNRILEIYVNAIEYGPAVYGVVNAARIYFDKHPREIEPIEAAFLAHLLPHPRDRYFQYCTGVMKKHWANKMQRILGRMHKRGRLTDDEYADAKEAPLVFNPVKDNTLCKKKPDW